MVQKKILFILFKRYKGILEGGGIINQRNLRMAQTLFGKNNVDVIYLHDESKKRSITNRLFSTLLFPFGYYNGVTPRFIKNILNYSNRYDYIFLGTSLFGLIAKKLHDIKYKGTIISHFHNVESVYYDSFLPKFMPGRNIIINCAKHNDGLSCKYANKIIVLNKRDAFLIDKIHGRKADFIIPIAMKDRFYTHGNFKTTSKKPVCMFIGSNFPANSEGVLWFVKNVLPYVDIDFRIVGKGMAKLQKENVCLSDISVISDVPYLDEYFYEADFMILPIFSGSGMKVKTCEAMMFGKNIIGTDETFEGYDVDFNKIGGKCNSANEYIKCINNYIENPVPKFNEYSRNVFLKYYSENAIENNFKKVFINNL